MPEIRASIAPLAEQEVIMSGPDASMRDKSLARAVLNFYDDFAEFNGQCAFLCTAMACLLADEGSNSERVIRGAEHWSFWLRQQMDELQTKLEQIHKCARSIEINRVRQD